MQMEVHPDEIYTVAVSLEDGSTIYAVAGEAEEKKLISLQQSIEEEKKISKDLFKLEVRLNMDLHLRLKRKTINVNQLIHME